jgi:monofunctional biosynthetic peptidoglycan transglycosylase
MGKARLSRKVRKAVRRGLLIAGVLALVFVVLCAVLWATGPDVGILQTRNPRTTAMMRYRQEQGLRKTGRKPAVRQTWVKTGRISPKLIHAVLIAEDDKFYQHEGFDFAGMKDAFEKNLESGRIVGGGSTITQQLAKNLYLKPVRNPVRKLREAVIAFELDRRLKKRRILELYLNVIEWGPRIYGAEAAAGYYYGKSASELTAEEAVRLASILPNPVRFRPEDDSSRRMRKKRRIVAEILVKRGLMTREEQAALDADLGHPVRTRSESPAVSADSAVAVAVTDTVPPAAVADSTI